MLRPLFTGQFKRDYKLAMKRGCDRKKLEAVIDLLCREETLPPSYRDHALVNSRNYKGMRESQRSFLKGLQKDTADAFLPCLFMRSF